jgi:hypothetical protein
MVKALHIKAQDKASPRLEPLPPDFLSLVARVERRALD